MRIRISRQRGTRSGLRIRLRRRQGAPGERAFVYESAGSRRGCADRDGVHRAGRGCGQAHQSLWCGGRKTIDQAYVRAREADSLAAFGGIIGLNRADRRGNRAGAGVNLHRSGDRAWRGGRCAARSCHQIKSASRRCGRDEPGDDLAGQRDLRSILGAILVQRRDEVVEARSAWSGPNGGSVRSERCHQTCSQRIGVGSAPVRMAHLRPRQVERRDFQRLGRELSRSVPAR